MESSITSRSSTSSSDPPARAFAVHAALFIAAILAAQTLIYFASGGDKNGLPDEIRALKKTASDGTTVLYLGDSVISYTESQGPQMQTLPKILQSRLPEERIAVVTHRAYHPGVYLSFAQSMARESHAPPDWIIPVNLRSLSAGWDQRPEYQFENERILLAHDSNLFRIFYRPMQVFKVFDLVPIKQPDFYTTPVYDGDRLAGHVREFLAPEMFAVTRARMKRMLIFGYMYSLRADHRKVRALVELCRVLKSRGIRPLVYITPVDYQTGEDYLGKRFRERIQENTAVVKRELAQAGVAPLDLSLSLGSDDFRWHDAEYPNEHLSQKGREQVAGRLAEALRNGLGPSGQ